MDKVLIIHGFGGEPNGGWRPWLMRELAKLDIYACSLPMPKPDTPDHEEWIQEIARLVDREEGRIFLVGHSLGAAAIMRYLEQDSAKQVAGTVLVGGPCHPADDPPARGFVDDPFDYEAIRAKCGKPAVIHGAKDTIVPQSHGERNAKGLRVSLTIVENEGHFNGSSGCYELPEVLSALQAMIQD